MTSDERTPETSFPNLRLLEKEQEAIVALCNSFKTAVKTHASSKKAMMRTCYAYTKSQFVGNDLLPIPSTLGSDKDLDSQRPKVFIPVIRQQIKQLYSYLKLTLFPNDQDFFRVRGKTPEAALLEETLTEGLKSKFREAMISEKIGNALFDVCWAGNAAVFPAIKDDIVWEWRYDHLNQCYVPVEIDTEPLPDIEVLNPIDFYIDPTCRDVDKAKWGYFGQKKLQEIKDSHLYFNKDKLTDLASKSVQRQVQQSEFDLSYFNGFSPVFEDAEENIDYDLYYFPYLKTDSFEYRNMLIGIAGERVLVRFHPNVFPRGMNPVVFFNYTPDVDSQYGTGPAEDMCELQRMINILYNYMIEVLSRIGNRFEATPDVDLSNLFGVAGGVAISPQIGSIREFTGNYTEINQLANIIGVIKAEAQITSGSQAPFQGSSTVDYKKTATELQILQENSISVLREVVEHVSIMGVQRILERLMYLCADLYHEPIVVRLYDVQGQVRYVDVDFSVLRSGQFTIELVGVNPSQSRQAQINGLMQLLSLMLDNPEAMVAGEPIIAQIGQLQGIKDIQNLMDQVKRRMGELHGAAQQGLSGSQTGLGVGQQQIVPGFFETLTGAESSGHFPQEYM